MAIQEPDRADRTPRKFQTIGTNTKAATVERWVPQRPPATNARRRERS